MVRADGPTKNGFQSPTRSIVNICTENMSKGTENGRFYSENCKKMNCSSEGPSTVTLDQRR